MPDTGQSVFNGYRISVLQDAKCSGDGCWLHKIWMYLMLLTALVSKLCLTLCDSMGYTPPESFVHGILRARTLEWAAFPFSWGSSWPRDGTQVSCIAGRFFTIWVTREAHWDVHPNMVMMVKLILCILNRNWKKKGFFFFSRKLTMPGPFWLSIHHSSDGSQKLSVAYVARFSPSEAWGFPSSLTLQWTLAPFPLIPWSLRVSPLPQHSGEHWPHFQLPGLVSLWSEAFSCKQSLFCLHRGSQKCLEIKVPTESNLLQMTDRS